MPPALADSGAANGVNKHSLNAAGYPLVGFASAVPNRDENSAFTFIQWQLRAETRPSSTQVPITPPSFLRITTVAARGRPLGS